MNSRNRSLPVLTLVPIASCSDNGVDDPATKPTAEQTEADSAEAIYLSDLDRSEPQSALFREWKHGTWRLVDYLAERDADDSEIRSIRSAFQQTPDPSRTFSGTFLLAMEDDQAPEIDGFRPSPSRSSSQETAWRPMEKELLKCC